MKVLKLLAFVTAITFLTATTAFAAPVQGTEKDLVIGDKKCADFDKDPVKALECRKAKVQSLLKEGKITKEEAAEKTARIDARIAKINEFNKLTLPQKKTKLMEEFKASVNNKVKDGRITREKADTITREFNEMITNWDGNGYPWLQGKWFKHGRHHRKDKPIAS